MHEKSEGDLRKLDGDRIAEKEDIDDARVMFRDEANASYNAQVTAPSPTTAQRRLGFSTRRSSRPSTMSGFRKRL